MKKIVIAICAVAMFASCATTKKATTLSALDGEWNVTEIKGKAVEAKPGENKPFIGFKISEKRVYRNSECGCRKGYYRLLCSRYDTDDVSRYDHRRHDDGNIRRCEVV